jgi:hypothetical protein
MIFDQLGPALSIPREGMLLIQADYPFRRH